MLVMPGSREMEPPKALPAPCERRDNGVFVPVILGFSWPSWLRWLVDFEEAGDEAD